MERPVANSSSEEGGGKGREGGPVLTWEDGFEAPVNSPSGSWNILIDDVVEGVTVGAVGALLRSIGEEGGRREEGEGEGEGDSLRDRAGSYQNQAIRISTQCIKSRG